MATKAAKLLHLSVEQIMVKDGFNKRFDYGDMQALMKSIKDTGQHTAISVVKTKKKLADGSPVYELIDGHRRFKAMEMIAKKLEEGEEMLIRAEERDPSDDEMDYYVQMYATGATQQSLNMLEKSDIVKVFLDGGYKQSAIAAKLSVTPTHIKDLIILVEKCTPDLRKLVEKGQMAATTLLETLKNGIPADILEDQAEQALAQTGKSKVTPKDLTKVAGRDLRKKEVDGVFDDAQPEEILRPTKKLIKASDETHPVFRLIGLRDSLKAQTDRIANVHAMRALDGIIDMLDESTGTEAVDLVPLFFEDAMPANKEDGKGKPPKKLKAKDDEVPKKATGKKAAPKTVVEYDAGAEENLEDATEGSDFSDLSQEGFDDDDSYFDE